VHLPFNFALLSAPWNARQLAKLIEEYEAALPRGGWPNWVLGNHDKPRLASRIGRHQARAAAMLLLTLRGTPTIYYGDEIGMEQVPIAPENVRDPFELRVPGQGLGRDGARTPMQWDEERYAGFSSAKPWLPLADNVGVENVAQQQADPNSIYHLHRKLIALRKAHPALELGSYRPLVASGDLLLYVRELSGSRIFVALNLGAEPAVVSFPQEMISGALLLSTFGDRQEEHVSGELALRAYEGIIVELS
jgi:alpha-glucosidase